MSRLIFSVAVASTTALLSACGGSSSSTPAAADDFSGLVSSLSTGSDSTDSVQFWNCDGFDGSDPVNFDLRLFADGEGSTAQQDVVFPLTWAATASDVVSVTFPPLGGDPGETFSINNISFSTVNTANDRFDATDSRDDTALACTRTTPTDTETPEPLAPVSELIVNSFVEISAGEFQDVGWTCELDGSDGQTSYEFNADGTGRRFGADFVTFADNPPALTWTADDANNTINIENNGVSGSLGVIQFSDNDTFTAIDSFEADGTSCTRSNIPNGPTPPPQPQPIDNTACPCSFDEALQFLTEQDDPTATAIISNIAGGRIVDISTIDGALQLSVRNTGILDCSLTSSIAGFAVADENESLSAAQAISCDADLDTILAQ